MPAQGSKPEKTPKSAGEQSRRYLQNAKRATKDSDGAPTPQADFLMKQANVMAILDLADAVRSQQK